MPRNTGSIGRREVVGAGLAMGAAAALAAAGHGAASAQERETALDSGGQDNAPFGRTDEGNLSADDATLPHRARDLIRIGESGIAREDAAAMDAFFHPDFRFHGPGGTEFSREELWDYFAACRAAFDDFSVTRQALVSDGGDYMASRTRFAGVFARPFTASPEGRLQPNGRPIAYDVVNIFRYAPDGRLAEEWVQYDVQAFLNQLKEPS